MPAWWTRLRKRTPDRTASHPFDDATGMDTAGLIYRPHEPYSLSYYATAPSLFRAVLERWGGAAGDYTFVDLGCGKGRVVLLAAEIGFRECVGVELDAQLCAIAQRNAAGWNRAVCPIRIVCDDATTFDFPRGKCLVYLFNPFPAHVFERLLDHIAAVFAQRPGELDLLYVNAECSHLLRSRRGFELLWQMPVVMSAEDAAADLLYASGFGEQEGCSGWRWAGPQSWTAQKLDRPEHYTGPKKS